MSSAGEARSIQRRDREVLEVLANRVRALSLEQIARTWWAEAEPARAKERMEALDRAGLVHVASSMAHPEVILSAPLATWQPDLAAPDLGLVSRVCAGRWSKPPVQTFVVVATREAGERFGGRGGRFPRTSELSHDLHLAQVYLRMKGELPTRARTWKREDEILAARHEPQGEKLPDAIVRDGLHETAIEFAGAYRREKLEAFHRYCEEKRLAYELW